ncbi:hypothetical protein Mlute_01790 [Meiothermus luteus]|uniref:Uncharacterized protein n=1 Tax=Meiothermus luteus TaxID=2026184 RepID=A0A399ELE3_9DEIN|nr:hypothetical protein [Meiothermus luteus]RIH84805.1 hypothetical protein Mlute_01790 [Meiothermus luteus]
MYCYHQVRSGALWVWRVRTTAQIPPDPALGFPGLQQIVEIHRHKTHKRTGEVCEETDLAIISLSPGVHGRKPRPDRGSSLRRRMPPP